MRKEAMSPVPTAGMAAAPERLEARVALDQRALTPAAITIVVLVEPEVEAVPAKPTVELAAIPLQPRLTRMTPGLKERKAVAAEIAAPLAESAEPEAQAVITVAVIILTAETAGMVRLPEEPQVEERRKVLTIAPITEQPERHRSPIMTEVAEVAAQEMSATPPSAQAATAAITDTASLNGKEVL